MENKLYICFIDPKALPLFRIERFLKPLVDAGSKAPVSLLRVSSFTAFRLDLTGPSSTLDASYTLIFQSLVQANSVLDLRKPRGQILFFMGLFLLFTFF